MARQTGSAKDDLTSATTLQILSEHAFGITSTSNAAFISHRPSGLLAYSAGCVIVIVDIKLKKQSRIVNLCKREVVSLSFTSDGKFIASGESGHKPAVRIWDVACGQLLCHFDGHDNAVPFVVFSPDDKYLVSVGNQYDNTINVWNWRKKERISSTKNTAEVHAVSFPENDSRNFLTVGKGHAKFWYIEGERASRLYLKGVVPYGSIAKKVFSSAVYVDRNHVIAAHSKNLCKFSIDMSLGRVQNMVLKPLVDLAKAANKERKDRWLLRSIEKSVSANHITSLAVDRKANRLFVGCDNGAIKVLDVKTLNSVETGSLPKPHRLNGVIDDRAPNYPDAIALTLMNGQDDRNLLAAVYSDHSIYVWDITNLSQVSKVTSWLSHSCRIFGLDVYPTVEAPLLPPNSFATCSNDFTIRIWKMSNTDSSADTTAAFNQELLHTIYCGDFLKESNGAAVANCVVFHPNGREIAAGFRNGTIRIYDLSNVGAFKTIQSTETTTNSVLALEYSRLPNIQLLASGGCDGFISVYNAAVGYSLQQSLRSLQSSAINGLRFALSKSDSSQVWLISSSQDKSLRLHGAKFSQEGHLSRFDDGRQIVVSCSPHDLEVNDAQGTIAVACHDRIVRLYEIQPNNNTNDPLCSYSGVGSSDGMLKRFSFDSSGSLIATICSDKTISVACRPWEVKKDRTLNDRIIATISGHSEQISSVKFFPNSRIFITTAGDSCVLIWRVPQPDQHTELRVVQASDSSTNINSSRIAAVTKSRTPSSSSSSRRSKNSSLSPPSAPTSAPPSPTSSDKKSLTALCLAASTPVVECAKAGDIRIVPPVSLPLESQLPVKEESCPVAKSCQSICQSVATKDKPEPQPVYKESPVVAVSIDEVCLNTNKPDTEKEAHTVDTATDCLVLTPVRDESSTPMTAALQTALPDSPVTAESSLLLQEAQTPPSTEESSEKASPVEELSTLRESPVEASTPTAEQSPQKASPVEEPSTPRTSPVEEIPLQTSPVEESPPKALPIDKPSAAVGPADDRIPSPSKSVCSEHSQAEVCVKEELPSLIESYVSCISGGQNDPMSDQTLTGDIMESLLTLTTSESLIDQLDDEAPASNSNDVPAAEQQFQLELQQYVPAVPSIVLPEQVPLSTKIVETNVNALADDEDDDFLPNVTLDCDEDDKVDVIKQKESVVDKSQSQVDLSPTQTTELSAPTESTEQQTFPCCSETVDGDMPQETNRVIGWPEPPNNYELSISVAGQIPMIDDALEHQETTAVDEHKSLEERIEQIGKTFISPTVSNSSSLATAESCLQEEPDEPSKEVDDLPPHSATAALSNLAKHDVQSEKEQVTSTEQDLANEMHELGLRLVQGLIQSPRNDPSSASNRRRVLQAMFQLRRDLDQCLEREFLGD